jgi:hypothetical protein
VGSARRRALPISDQRSIAPGAVGVVRLAYGLHMNIDTPGCPVCGAPGAGRMRRAGRPAERFSPRRPSLKIEVSAVRVRLSPSARPARLRGSRARPGEVGRDRRLPERCVEAALSCDPRSGG